MPDVPDRPTSEREAAAMLDAMHDVLTQAAVQGQSMFAAAGDGGAYTVTGFFIAGFPQDTLMTAASGTTLPNSPQTANSTEWAWGWDYMSSFPDFFFPTGGGGGVSSYFPRPVYQLGVPGMLNTEPGQIQITFRCPRFNASSAWMYYP